MSKRGSEGGMGRAAAVGLGLAALVGAWKAPEPIANWIIGNPPPVGDAPPPPEYKPGVREPVQVAIGFDRTRSAIKDKLPGVVQSTRDFLGKTMMFQDGDKVIICTFAEEADDCKEFAMPKDKDAMLAKVAGIAPEAPRQRMMTYVHRAIAAILGRTTFPPDRTLATAWTDGIDDDKEPKSPLPNGHAQVEIVVPDSANLAPANQVKDSLSGGTGNGVEVVLAEDAKTFGKKLEGFVGRLKARADEKAKRAADDKFDKDKKEFDGKLAKYQENMRTFDDRKAATAASIGRFKKWIQIGFGSLATAAAMAFVALLRLQMRPRVFGWILNVNGTYSQKYELPSVTDSIDLSTVSGELPSVTLSPKKDGMYQETKKLTSGVKLSNGVYWFAEEPDPATIKRLLGNRGDGSGPDGVVKSSALDF